MKKAYVKPELKSSMKGTLEGVYACPDYSTSSNKNNCGWDPCYDPCKPKRDCGYSMYICW